MELTLDDLMELIVTELWRFPVREMEAVLEWEDEGKEEDTLAAVLEGLDFALARENSDEPTHPLWPLILLGELRDPGAVPALEKVLRRSGPGDLTLPVAAAEALAKIGEPALPALERLVSEGEPHHRLWAYAVLGWTPGDASYGLLTGALAADPELADVVAMALSDLRRAEAIPLLHETLQHCHPWQRMELEQAIRNLHRGESLEYLWKEDWRLRYRVDPMLGAPPLAWPEIASIAREQDALQHRRALPLRALEEILAEAELKREVERCECCDVPIREGTGVPVCPAMAPSIALLQGKMLGALAEDEWVEDIFEALEVVESELLHLQENPAPRGRKARERYEDRRDMLRVLREGCIWVIRQGIEDVQAGQAALLAEAPRAASEYGGSDELFEPSPRPAALSAARVGRNEPCPCGSGRKYKKCCGRGGKAHQEAAAPAARPVLVNFDHEPVALCRAHFSVSDEAAVRSTLAAAPGLEGGEDGAFDWVRSIEEEEKSRLGSIELGEGRLTLECNSRERLERGKQLLLEVAGDWLTHRADTMQDMWRAAEEASARGVLPQESELPPEVEAQAIQSFLDKHYSTWPDTALPALGGQTPREAARRPEGRRALIELLDSMDEMEQKKPATQRYDFGRLRKELGVDPAR